MFVILKLGTTVAPLIPRRGDFEHWFAAGLGRPLEAFAVVEPARGDALPDPADCEAAVLTGSSAMVTDAEPWSVRSEGWVRELVERERPVLGICYGHQLLAHAFGGEVGWNPRGREIGTVELELTEDGRREPLLSGIEPPPTFQTSHRQSVLRLPESGRALLCNAHDAHQGFAFGPRAWGFQFHPEFDADIIRGYLDARGDALSAEGIDTGALRGRSRDSGHGTLLLAAFAREVERG